MQFAFLWHLTKDAISKACITAMQSLSYLRLFTACFAISIMPFIAPFSAVTSGPKRPAHPHLQDTTEQSRAALQREIADATLIVQGRIKSIGSAGGKSVTKGISEHASLMQAAMMVVEKLVKGKTTAKVLKIYFAASDDVRWQGAPKLQPGQRGIFLLQWGPLPASDAKGFGAFHSLSVQTLNRLAQIRQLL